MRKAGNGICEYCATPFQATKGHTTNGCWWQRFCSDRCRGRLYKLTAVAPSTMPGYRSLKERQRKTPFEASFAKATVSRIILGEIAGPAMQALPSNRYRAFVEFYLSFGNGAEAARRAGFAFPSSTSLTFTQTARRLRKRPYMVAALKECTERGPPFDGTKWLAPDLVPCGSLCRKLMEEFDVAPR